MAAALPVAIGRGRETGSLSRWPAVMRTSSWCDSASLAGPTGGGRRIAGARDSETDYECYRDDRLMPALSGLGRALQLIEAWPATETVRILEIRRRTVARTARCAAEVAAPYDLGIWFGCRYAAGGGVN